MEKKKEAGKRNKGNYSLYQKFLISDGSQKLQKEFLMCWKYLKESKIYFLIVLGIFIFSVILGMFFPVFLVDYITELVKKLAEETSGLNFLQLFFFILKNNLITAFFGLIFGIVFGLFPVSLAFLNGYVLGFISGKVADVAGFSSLIRLLPHGVFEIPALVLSLGLGLKLGMFLFVKNKRKQLKYDLENSLRVFLFVIIPLLLIAGVIETGLIFLFG